MANIEHVIVLMMENASFDRMVGAVPGVEGVDPAKPRTNPNPPAPSVAQAVTTLRQIKNDPQHDLANVLHQLSNGGTGFVADFANKYPNSGPPERAQIMGYYTKNTLSVIQTLAANFAVCDHWFSSLPGPTWPNRFFVHSGTSLGHVDMPESLLQPGIHIYNQTTLYELLQNAGVPWAIYFGDIPQSLVMTHQWSLWENYHPMSQFFTDAQGAEASFPKYVFIEPSYFGKNQNDQHPPSDVMRGELLIAQIYNAIRANDALWKKSLLVVLYDEHGGFYDHVPPPPTIPPDANVKNFAFNQYGVRVPAVLVSPWIAAGKIIDVFDHTSLLAYAMKKWSLPDRLGARAAVAKSFEQYVEKLAAPREGVLPSIPEPDVLDNDLTAPMTANQRALESLSHLLEVRTALLNQSAGMDAAKVFADIGQRLVEPAQAAPGQDPADAITNRLNAFFEANRAVRARQQR